MSEPELYYRKFSVVHSCSTPIDLKKISPFVVPSSIKNMIRIRFNGTLFRIYKNQISCRIYSEDSLKINEVYKELLDFLDIKIWDPKYFYFYCKKFKEQVLQLYLINKKLRVIHKDILPLIIEIISKDYIPFRVRNVHSKYKINIDLERFKTYLLEKNYQILSENTEAINFCHDNVNYSIGKNILDMTSISENFEQKGLEWFMKQYIAYIF